MTCIPLSDDDLKATLDLLAFHGENAAEASRASGIPASTIKHHRAMAAKRGLLGFEPVLPGFEVKQTSSNIDGVWVKTHQAAEEEFVLPMGQALKGVSALLDPSGRVRAKWVKTKEGVPDLPSMIEALKTAFTDFEGGAGRRVGPSIVSDDLLTLVPCNDWHINMLAWEREADENWDLKIAESTLGATVRDIVDRSPPSSLAIVLGGGDMLHSDDNEARTKRSGHALDVDGRHQKGIEVAQRLKVMAIDAALERHGSVLVRILPGNHDEMSSVAVAYFLKAWYRDEPRVVVDVDPSLFFFRRFGRVMLGATHGHTVKLRQLPMIMANRRAEDWGATVHRYAHGFHVHHRELHGWEEDGVVGETHQAPIPQDGYHYGAGFISGRSMQSITYHAEYGEYSRVRQAVLRA